MTALLKRLIQYQDQGRQHRYASDHAEDYALRHNETEVAAHGEAHKTKCDKTGDRGYGTSDNTAQGLTDRHRHRVLIIRVVFALLIVAVPQEDGIVHGDRQLKDGGKCFCNIGDLAEEIVRAEIQKDHHADRKQEYDRRQKTVQKKHHREKRQYDRDSYIDRFFSLAQLFKVRDQCAHAGDEALLIGDLPDLSDRLHRLIGGCRCVEEYRHDGRVVGVKCIVQFFRKHFHRH